MAKLWKVILLSENSVICQDAIFLIDGCDGHLTGIVLMVWGEVRCWPHLKIKSLTWILFNQEMKQELVDFKDVISSLQLLSKKVVPLPQRKSKLKSKLLVDPVCSYKNMQVSLIYTRFSGVCAKFLPRSRWDLDYLTEIGKILPRLPRLCRDLAMMFVYLYIGKILVRFPISCREWQDVITKMAGIFLWFLSLSKSRHILVKISPRYQNLRSQELTEILSEILAKILHGWEDRLGKILCLWSRYMPDCSTVGALCVKDLHAHWNSFFRFFMLNMFLINFFFQNIVNKGEECILLDNSEHHSWKVCLACNHEVIRFFLS